MDDLLTPKKAKEAIAQISTNGNRKAALYEYIELTKWYCQSISSNMLTISEVKKIAIIIKNYNF